MRKPNPMLFFGVLALLLASTLLLGADGAYAADDLSRPDTTGNVGRWSSQVLDSSGYAVVAYVDGTNAALNVLHCGNAACDSGNTIESFDVGNLTDYPTAIQLDSSGNPIVAFYSTSSQYSLKLLNCNDPDCAGTGDTIEIVDDGARYGNGHFVLYHLSMVLDGSGNPAIAYQSIIPLGYNFGLKVARCADPDCSGDIDIEDLHTDLGNGTGFGNSIVLDGDGYPVISFADTSIKVLHCDDAVCAGDESGNVETIGTSSGNPSRKSSLHTSIALDGDGYPIVTFQNDDLELEVVHCNDADCAGSNESEEILDTIGPAGLYLSMVLDGDGYPAISYHTHTFGDLKVFRCDDEDCSTGEGKIVARDDHAGAYTSIRLNSSGYPVVSHNHQDTEDLGIAACDSTACDSADELVDTDNDGCADDDEGTLGGTSSTVYDFADTPDLYGHRDRVITSVEGGDGDVQRFLARFNTSGTFDADARWDIPTDTTSYHSAFDLNGDGTIDLANDILGAINQVGDDCN